MKKMTTEEKLDKCIDFLKMFNEYEFYKSFDDYGEKVYQHGTEYKHGYNL